MKEQFRSLYFIVFYGLIIVLFTCSSATENTVVPNLLYQSFTRWVSKTDNTWPQAPIALSTLDYQLTKMIKLKKKASLTDYFVCSFPNIQLFVLFFSLEVLYSEPPVALLNFSPNFRLSWTYSFPINFCCHPLCRLLILIGGTPALPAWMRKNELDSSCRCHKAPRALWDVGYPSNTKACKGKVEAKNCSTSSRVFLICSRALPGVPISLPTLIRKF